MADPLVAIGEVVQIHKDVMDELTEAFQVSRELHRQGKLTGFIIILDPGHAEAAMVWTHHDDHYKVVGMLEYTKKTLMEI